MSTACLCQSARTAKMFLDMLAGIPQVSRRYGWRLRDSRKSHGDMVGVCGTPASLTEMQLAFAGLPQVSRRYGWRLQDSRKSHGDAVGVCGTSVDTLPT